MRGSNFSRGRISGLLFAGVFALSLLAASSFGMIPRSFGTAYVLSQSTCVNVMGATWDSATSTCYLNTTFDTNYGNTFEIPGGTNLVIQGEGSFVVTQQPLTIDSGATVTIQPYVSGVENGIISYGDITNRGTIYDDSYAAALGGVYLSGGLTFDNYGTVNIADNGQFVANSFGSPPWPVFDNYGTVNIYNTGVYYNAGEFTNEFVILPPAIGIVNQYCGGVFQNENIFNEGIFPTVQYNVLPCTITQTTTETSLSPTITATSTETTSASATVTARSIAGTITETRTSTATETSVVATQSETATITAISSTCFDPTTTTTTTTTETLPVTVTATVTQTLTSTLTSTKIVTRTHHTTTTYTTTAPVTATQTITTGVTECLTTVPSHSATIPTAVFPGGALTGAIVPMAALAIFAIFALRRKGTDSSESKKY